MPKKKRIAVIGAGFGGLAAANRLAAKGHEVHLFDKRDKPGGRGYQYEVNGFKFDGGPTVITAPHLFDEIFEAAGKKRDDYFKLKSLDPFYRIFNAEGRYFDYRRRLQDMLAEIDKWNPKDKKGYQKFVLQTQKLFASLYPYTDQPFIHLNKMLRIMPDVIRLHGWRGTYGFVSRYIKDDFLRRVFSFHPLLIGGSPLDTPALYTLIVQFEKEWGVHYAIGGTGAIVEGLRRLFEESGGRLHLSAEVREIVVENHRVKGLIVNGEKTPEPFDAVVSNGDVSFTYRHLIKEEHRRKWSNRRIDAMNYSNSLVVVYFGTKKRYLDSKLHHHNIIVNPRYKELLKDVFDRRKLPEDFSLYLHMPTKTDPSIAPEGSESFYVLSLVPHLNNEVDWNTFTETYRDRILEYLEEHYLPGLRENIVALHHIDPLHFQNTLNSYKGAAFAARPTLLQSAYFRPHARSEEFENLYFAGAGTHPGAGVPAVLSSGKIAAQLIDPDG